MSTSTPASVAFPAARALPGSRGGSASAALPASGITYDATVAVDRTTPNATRAISLTTVAPWMTSTRFAGWRANFSGSGTAYNAGSRPVYEGDGTSDNPGASVTQAMARFSEVAGRVVINAVSYNSATGNPWPDPTADCPASDTTTYPYYGHSATSGTGAIPYVDGDGYFWPASGANGADTGNPWATLDLKVMQARALTAKANIVLCLRAAPSWMTATWQASSTNGGSANLSRPADPNHFVGSPPLMMTVKASGTASSTIGWGGWFTTGVSAGASGGTLKAAGTGQWGSGTANVGLSNGDTLTLEPGTAREEVVTLASLNTSTGVMTITGTFAFAHGANTLAVKDGGTRIIASFWGGNAATSGQAATGHAPTVGQPWTFFDCYTRLAQRIAERYPWVQWYLSWGEPGNTNKAPATGTNDNGAWLQTNNVWWDDDASGHLLQASPAWTPGGRNNITPATVLYNKERNALKNIPGRNYTTYPLKMGGPYHSCGLPVNATTLQTADDGVLTVFFNNAVGLDFVVVDGFSLANTNSVAPAADPTTGLALASQIADGLNAVRTKATGYAVATGLDIWEAETYFDSNLAHLDYSNPSVGPAVTNWLTHQVQGMIQASLLYQSILGGAAMVARWQAQGDSSGSFNGFADGTFGGTDNMFSLVSTTKNSDAFTSGLTAAVLGQPFPAHAVYKSIRDYFGLGTALKVAVVTDGSASAGKTVLALASASRTLIVNQYPSQKIIGLSINGGPPTPIVLPAYGVALA